jgi:phosphate transport system permease protein
MPASRAPLLFTAPGGQSGLQGILMPIRALPLPIYKYALSPCPDWQQARAAAFLPIVSVLGIIVLVRWTSNRRRV